MTKYLQYIILSKKQIVSYSHVTTTNLVLFYSALF